jgi:dienelactone hydrolase
MLGLFPFPARQDLKPVVTGQVERDSFIVEKLHFQSLPGLYVTANLYRPKQQQQPAPAILYLSGHGPVISNGISYGNKVAYQHHGAWFARNGYVCMIIDTVELGEIQGVHHGTYKENMWWWNARGYTPAGVEAWNSIRALDYLETRAEVDTNRFGVTGRSGGGAYSWWVAALDPRIKVAAPVAGITDLRNHVVDGTIEGHCDCMFMVNSYQWDYPQVAALIAPRPLMIANSDRDTIFPLDGVVRVHAKVRQVYRSYNAATNLALLITEGPHKDTQDLQLPVFRWFNRHLRHEEPLIEMAAVKFFKPEDLKVFDHLPTDAINSRIHETFVPIAKQTLPESPAQWNEQRRQWLAELKSKSFAGWPESSPLNLRTLSSAEHAGLRFWSVDFTSQDNVRLRLYILAPAEPQSDRPVMLHVLDADKDQPPGSSAPELGWERWSGMMHAQFGEPFGSDSAAAESVTSAAGEESFMAIAQGIRTNHHSMVYVAPRGVGSTQWNQDERAQIQIRRRFMLLGQTVDSMRVWDIRRAVQALCTIPEYRQSPITIRARRNLAADAVYASIFENRIGALELWHLPRSHRKGPDFLNVLRVLDTPESLSMAASRIKVVLHGASAEDWSYATSLSERLGWKEHVAFAE